MAEEHIHNEDLAKYVGVTVETISKWRNNRGQPPLKKLYRIAEFFKQPVCDFLAPRLWDKGPSAAALLKIKKEVEKEKNNKSKSSKKKPKGKG